MSESIVSGKIRNVFVLFDFPEVFAHLVLERFLSIDFAAVGNGRFIGFTQPFNWCRVSLAKFTVIVTSDLNSAKNFSILLIFAISGRNLVICCKLPVRIFKTSC